MVDQTIRAESSIVWFPKKGHHVREYEDAFSMPEKEGTRLRAAVADGATESAFSGKWARILVREAVTVVEDDFDAIIQRSRRAFEEDTAPLMPHLAWYAQAKLEEGAFAAFMVIDWSVDHKWRSTAVGDCCLFHYRGVDRLCSWPFETKGALHNRPVLLSSDDEPSSGGWLVSSGCWQPGDQFILTTDAAASWLLDRPAAGDIEKDVHKAYREGAIRDDDITIMTVRLNS